MFETASQHKLMLTLKGNLAPFGDSKSMIPHDTPGKPSAEYAVEFIRQKLVLCHGQHTDCRTTRNFQLPRRVLDLQGYSSSRLIKLTETQNALREAYVTLILCWGRSGTVPKTTQANIQDRYTSIVVADLTPTFRDAALLTHHLGVRCL